MVNNVVKILLLVVIIVLAYLVYESVMRPVRFNKEVNKRSEAVIQNLKDIRSAQLAYKTIHHSYTGSFDNLVDFLRNGEIPVVKMVPDPEDTTFTKTITDTLGYIPVIDSLFGKSRSRLLGSLRVRYRFWIVNQIERKSGGQLFKWWERIGRQACTVVCPDQTNLDPRHKASLNNSVGFRHERGRMRNLS